MNILIMTPVGRTDDNQFIDYFPTRWSGSSGKYKSTTFYPFNLAYLTSYLKMRSNYNIKMVDVNYYGVDTNEYINIVTAFNPDVYIVEIDAIIYRKQVNIIKKIRAKIKNIIIIVCGPSPTSSPHYFLNNGCNFVALGEFEESITELILSNFKKKITGIYPNGYRQLIDINKLPFPEDRDIKRRDYCRYYASEYNEVELFATRGCPHMCNFCVYANIYANKPSFRTRTVVSVIEEIKYLRSTIKNLEGIFFNDESHTNDKRYITKLCNAIKNNGLGDLKYNCMTNYDRLDAELLTIMKSAGYYKIRIGIETLDEDNAQFITKTKIKAVHEKLMNVLNICKEINMKVYATISVGTRKSSLQKDLNSLSKLKYLYNHNYIQEFSVSINTPMPGTPFYDECIKDGSILTDASFDGSSSTSISFPHYSSQEINIAYNEFNSFRQDCIKNNISKGIRYSMYDSDKWAKPAYDITSRVIGDDFDNNYSPT